VAVVTLWALGAAKAYGLSQRESLPQHLGRIVTACVAGAVVGVAAAFATDAGRLAPIAGLAAALLVGLGALHLWDWTSVRRWRAKGRLTPNVVVVGATANAARLIESALTSREVNVLGIFDDRSDRVPSDLHGVPVLGDTAA